MPLRAPTPRLRRRRLPALILAAALATGPGWAQGDAGAYLAAREAGLARDVVGALPFLERLFAAHPDDPVLRQRLVQARVLLGRVGQAAELAAPLAELEPRDPVAGLALVADGFARRDFATVLARVEGGGQGSPLLDELAEAWAQLGLGRVTEALAALDRASAEPGADLFASFCRALILAMVGDAEGALAILDVPNGLRDMLNRRGAMAYVQLLGQVDRFDDALAEIEARFPGSPDPQLTLMRAAYETRQSLPFDMIAGPAEGMAEVYALMAGVILSPQNAQDALLYAQAALAISPGLSDARLITGQIFDELGLPELAEAAYGAIAPDDALALPAALGRAQTLAGQDRLDEAIETLQATVAAHPGNLIAPQVLGDVLRRAGRHDEAIAAYSLAIDAMRAAGREPGWPLLFARAVSHERSGQWPQAEADFRAALAVDPDQPTVLNYLGYSLVERREKLDEALEMIERAVAGEPDSGYIVDSLAWALFRLGRYDEALPVMERAVALLPADPILNDHLGDIFWAVGRQREARFQWRRALSFGPHDDLDMDRVRRKLEVGLDQVLVEDGAEPLHPAR